MGLQEAPTGLISHSGRQCHSGEKNQVKTICEQQELYLHF